MSFLTLLGLVLWNEHLYHYLRAIHDVISRVERASRTLKDCRPNEAATQQTAEKVAVVWEKWHDRFGLAFTKEMVETFWTRRAQGLEGSLSQRKIQVDRYLVTALRDCLKKPRPWRQSSDEDVKNVRDRLIAQTGAQHR